MMNLKNWNSRVSKGLAAVFIRMAGIPALTGVAIALLVTALPSPSISQIPPPCQGVPEPGEDPTCVKDGQCEGTDQSPCGGDHYGAKYRYCCVETTPITCDQVVGRWKCCGTGWVKECLLYVNAGSTCDTNGQCYGN